jgi:hypothetical protein
MFLVTCLPLPETDRSYHTSDWYFYTEDDPTHGNVQYESRENAKDLAYVQEDGVAVLKVDGQSDVPAGGKRRSCVLQPPPPLSPVRN